MTVQNTTDKAGPYAGAGTKGPFAVGFRFLEETHLQVIKTDPTGADTILALTTDYTVAGVDNESGGSVTLTANLPAGYKLTVLRNVPATQLADYVDGDSFPAESHERALDKLTMISQQLTEQVSRAAKLPVTSAADAQLLTNNIMRLANSANNIDTVAGSVGSVDLAAENMPAIIDAPAQAQAAANSAQAAGESAGDAAQTYTDFDKRYLGSKSADPSTDNQGGALLAGALYWNSSSGAMRVYGTAWSDVAQGVSFPYQTFSGTGTQTAFTLSGAPGSLGSLEVFISGVRQVPVTNYTLSGTTLTFVTAPPSGTNNVFARWVTTQAINVPAAGSVGVEALKENFALPIAKGGTGNTTAASAFGAIKQNATTASTGVVALATSADVASGAAGKVVDAAQLKSAVDFTIIYPNGGTEAAPANVAANSRYVLPSPFPNSHLICVAEVLYGGQWGETGWYTSYSGSAVYVGVKASTLGDSIVVQTGLTRLLNTSNSAGNPFNTGDVSTPLPCRVKIWKVKGSIA